MPLGLQSEDVWFTDVVDRFFVKRNGKVGAGRQQGDAIEQEYKPFGNACGLPAASLPVRPSVDDLVRLGSSTHRDRLRQEIREAAPSLVISLGEEARRVLAAVVDDCSGPPTNALDRRTTRDGSYGGSGVGTVSGVTFRWYALVHPGQRSPAWSEIHDTWTRVVEERTGE